MSKSRSKFRILIVDDHEDAGQTLCMLLSGYGHECRYVTTGEAALAEAPKFKPHLVVMDLGLPGIDGFDAAKQLRAIMPSTLKIVALSGWQAPRDVARALAAGMDEHLGKPLRLGLLLDFIGEIRKRYGR